MYARSILLLTLCASANAFAWGHQGHEVAGAIADQLLTRRAAQPEESERLL